MGDLLESFLSSVRARTKHAGKARGDLWGQSTILEAVPDNYPRLERGQGVTIFVCVRMFLCRYTCMRICIYTPVCCVYVYMNDALVDYDGSRCRLSWLNNCVCL